MEFWEKYPNSKNSLLIWYQVTYAKNWNTPKDVKADFGDASILKEGQVVFNIKGNTYRLVTRINFKNQWVFIRFIGTHSEYDKIDAQTI